MKTPKFWNDENIISLLLYPFSIIYGFFRSLHVLFSSEYKTKLKVFCVGNFTAGGSGKTPICIEVGKILKNKGIKFAYLSKGYKGSINEFTKVDLNKHKPEEVGDEPFLLSEIADTFVCKNRRIAIENLAKNFDYEIIVMDDGFQNPTIYKDKNIIVIDGEYGIGNGELLPSGPLREDFKKAIKKATFFVIIGQDKQHLEDFFINNNIKVIRGYIKEEEKFSNKENYLAFCGIGRPSKFFNSLKKLKYNVVKEMSFSDHCKYKIEDLEKITAEAHKINAKIITTKKDWVKLTNDYKKEIDFLDITIEFYNNDEFKELVLK